MGKAQAIIRSGVDAARRIDVSVARATGPGSPFDRGVRSAAGTVGRAARRAIARGAEALALERRAPQVAQGLDGVRSAAARSLRVASSGDGPMSWLIGGALVLVFGWIVVTVLWDVLALVPRTINGVVVAVTPKTCAAFGRPGLVSDTVCGTLIAALTVIGALTSMLLAILLRIPIRRILATVFGWLPRDAAFLGPPLLATALFTMGWAGVQYHFRERPGLVSDGLFPVVFGLAVLVLVRAWPAVAREGSLIAWRERLAPRVRWLVVAGVPIVLALVGTPLLAAPVRDQVVALAALVVGYAMLAPAARPPRRTGT